MVYESDLPQNAKDMAEAMDQYKVLLQSIGTIDNLGRNTLSGIADPNRYNAPGVLGHYEASVGFAGLLKALTDRVGEGIDFKVDENELSIGSDDLTYLSKMSKDIKDKIGHLAAIFKDEIPVYLEQQQGLLDQMKGEFGA